MLWYRVTSVASPLTPLRDIERAAIRIHGTVVRTPLVAVSRPVGRSFRLKAENLQMAGSFKLRGASNMMLGLSSDERQRGVVTYSSGNHAQAVAYSARLLGISALVVMPVTAPDVKVLGAKAFGAEVVMEGTTSAERNARAEYEADVRGLTVVPPFYHPKVIAGQGTVGLEIVEDCPDVDCVYVPIGGGGLIAAVSAAVKQTYPHARVIGGEPVGAAKMLASLYAGRPKTLSSVNSVADGLLPVRPGDLTFLHVKEFVDTVVTVKDDVIERAVAWLFRSAKLVVEPSGAVTVAAALAAIGSSDYETCVAVVSGGNISSSALSKILNTNERCEASNFSRQQIGDSMNIKTEKFKP